MHLNREQQLKIHRTKLLNMEQTTQLIQDNKNSMQEQSPGNKSRLLGGTKIYTKMEQNNDDI
jgi:hypothetical protein